MRKKAQGFGTGMFVMLLITVAIVSVFWMKPKIFFAQVESAHEIVDKTYDADNAIANYEWFKTQHEKILATEKQIDNSYARLESFKEMYGDPMDWDYSTRGQYSRYETIYLGQMNHYENLVADYNARSSMANREIFKDSLPYNIDKKIW